MEYITENFRALLGILGTAVIAGWVAFSVSAPRNVDNAMNQPMEQLGGSSINETIKKSQDEARQMHCETYTDLAQKAWDRAVEQGTLDRDGDKLDELDRQKARFCD